MADLNDLIGALREVASAYNGKSDDDERDDSIDTDEDAPDNRDEEGEDDEDDDDVYAMRSSKAARLVAKLELQEEREWEKQWEKQRQQALHPKVTQEVRDEQSISMICRLRKQTTDAYYQLEFDRRLKAERDHFLASRQLREANLRAEEKRARAAETRRGQILFSRMIPELSPTWREEATLAFKNHETIAPTMMILSENSLIGNFSESLYIGCGSIPHTLALNWSA